MAAHGKYTRRAPWPRRLPRVPFAAYLWDTRTPTPTTSVLALDLDAHGNPEQVDQALAWLLPLLTDAGARLVVDRSDTGGAHVWVPLAESTGPETMAVVMATLQDRLVDVLDTSPMSNSSDGCLTVPGSPQKAGGHRSLITPLHEAERAVKERSAPDVLAELCTRLDVDLDAELTARARRRRRERDADRKRTTRATTDDQPLPSGSGRSTPERGHRKPCVLPPAAAEFARHGTQGGQHVPRGQRSELRFSVLLHAAWSGLSWSDVRTRLASDWHGLIKTVDNSETAVQALHEDYQRALAKRQFRVTEQPNISVHRGGASTRPPGNTHVLATAHCWLRSLGLRYPQREHLVATLQSVAHLAACSPTQDVAAGVRAIALGAGLDSRRTIATRLAWVRDEIGSPLLQTAQHSGAAADGYTLVAARIDGAAAEPSAFDRFRAENSPVHEAWHHIGIQHRLVYDALRYRRRASTVETLATLAEIQPRDVRASVRALAAVGLVERDGTLIRRTRRSLDQVATETGTTDDRAEHIQQYAHERHQYRTELAQRRDLYCRPAVLLSANDHADYLTALLAEEPPDSPSDPVPALVTASHRVEETNHASFSPPAEEHRAVTHVTAARLQELPDDPALPDQERTPAERSLPAPPLFDP